nr:MAG TPA: hypothetical protein [Bacteriophage sp.]
MSYLLIIYFQKNLSLHKKHLLLLLYNIQISQ